MLSAKLDQSSSIPEPGALRNVLMITYTFAPSAWVGVYRNLKHCKFLPEFGWLPTVLTARIGKDSFVDERLTAQIPSRVQVVRTWDFDPAKIEAKLAERKVAALRAELSDVRPDQANARMAQLSAAPASSSAWQRAKQILKIVAKEMPDSHVFWMPFALIAGSWVLARRRFDVIYCSSPPHSSQMLGYLLARLHRKPFVLDFRDPWYVVGSARPPNGNRPGWISKWEARRKRVIVMSAAQIVCVSSGERRELLAEIPELDPARVSVITNGFDPDDSRGAEAVSEDPDRVVLLHAGTIYPGVADELFGALEVLDQEEPATARRIRLDLIGDIAFEYLPAVDRLAKRGLVRNLGMVSHARALGMMKASDVLVILMGGDKYEASHLPSKSFEYLQSNQPILAVAQRGELSAILEHAGRAEIVPPRDVGALVAALRRIVSGMREGPISTSRDEAYVARFHRRALSSQLAEVLRKAMTHPAARTEGRQRGFG